MLQAKTVTRYCDPLEHDWAGSRGSERRCTRCSKTERPDACAFCTSTALGEPVRLVKNGVLWVPAVLCADCHAELVVDPDGWAVCPMAG